MRLTSTSRSTRRPTANEDCDDLAFELPLTAAVWLEALPAPPWCRGAGPPVARATLSARAATASASSPNASRRWRRMASLRLARGRSRALRRAAAWLARSDGRRGMGGTRPHGNDDWGGPDQRGVGLSAPTGDAESGRQACDGNLPKPHRRTPSMCPNRPRCRVQTLVRRLCPNRWTVGSRRGVRRTTRLATRSWRRCQTS